MANKENKIEVKLPNGYKLVAEQNTDPDYPYEIFVGLVAPGGGWVQDLATIRNAYTYKNGEVNWAGDLMEVLVYGRSDEEDYTESFEIDLWKGGE